MKEIYMIYIILLVLYLIFYFNVIVEKPKVYYSNKMQNIFKDMPSLTKNIYWMIGCHNRYIQYIIYSIESTIDNIIGNKFYNTDIITTNDNEKILIGIGNINYNYNGILLVFHTILGDYRDNCYSVKNLCKQLNLLPISYSRRGHSFKMQNIKFNTTGHIEDLELVLDYIENNYPNKPIYGYARSAGTSLLARYLGNIKYKSRISLAILISSGFNFKESIKQIPFPFNKILVNKFKNFWLKKNKNLFSKNKKDLQYYNLLLNSTSLDEWHKYQWYFSKMSKNRLEYNNTFNPIYVLKNIQIPILYINAMDDFLFSKSLVKKYKSLVNNSNYKVIVHTNHGSHLGFYENFFNDWSIKITKEFILSVQKNMII